MVPKLICCKDFSLGALGLEWQKPQRQCQSEGGETPRTAYAIPGRVGYGSGSCRRVRRFRFRFRRFRSRRVVRLRAGRTATCA